MSKNTNDSGLLLVTLEPTSDGDDQQGQSWTGVLMAEDSSSHWPIKRRHL